jgi:hypothetical protein
MIDDPFPGHPDPQCKHCYARKSLTGKWYWPWDDDPSDSHLPMDHQHEARGGDTV